MGPLEYSSRWILTPIPNFSSSCYFGVVVQSGEREREEKRIEREREREGRGKEMELRLKFSRWLLHNSCGEARSEAHTFRVLRTYPLQRLISVDLPPTHSLSLSPLVSHFAAPAPLK